MIKRFVVLLLLAALASAGPATAQQVLTGQTPGGAFYRIVVPDGWIPEDGLVIWNHGFSLSPPSASVDLGPLAPIQLAQGYAVAASSYRLNGWAVFDTVDDTRELIEVFERDVGVPEQMLVYGASLGGLVTAQLLEEPDMEFAGALPICGALAGSRTWDGAIDLRLAYDAICGGVPLAAIPGGETGLPAMPDPPFNEVALTAAVNACTGILLAPAARSPEQEERLERLLNLTTIPEEFLLTTMGFATFGLADLVFAPEKLDGRNFAHNLEVAYGDLEVDETIQRVQADPEDRRFFDANFIPTGVIGPTKIISLHTDKDGLVIVENESFYQRLVPADQFTVAVAVEGTPSHCGFREAEVLAGWESLRTWVAGLPQPDAGQLQLACEALVLGEVAAGPCRLDPGYEIGAFEDRVAPRAGVFEDSFEKQGFDRDPIE